MSVSSTSDFARAPRKPRRSTGTASTVVPEEEYIDPECQDVFLLKPSEDLSESETIAQNSLFEELSDSGIQPRWLSQSSALGIKEGDHHFYVLPAFRGEVFDHLKSVRVKVLGSSLVRECLHKGHSLPKWTHPVFSMNMTGTIVAFTGLTVEHREKLADYVRWMNGNVSKTFHDAVTHLVTERCVSKNDKYRSARLLKVPVLIPDWILDGWNMSPNAQFDDIAFPEYIRKYRLPIFSRMVICTSGISGADRMSMMRLIEMNGGQCPPEMARGVCTHLATDNPTSEKYRRAKEWKSVSIVQLRWITKCIDEGYVLNEKHFDPVSRAARSSTQKPEAESLAVLDESSILGPLRHTLNSQMHHTLQSPNLSMLSTSIINKTPATNPRTTLLRKESVRRNSGSFASVSMISNPAFANDPIDTVNEEIFKKDFDFLEGYMIWICGATEPKLEKWNRALDRCGATRGTNCEASLVIVVNDENDRHHLLKLQNKGIEVIVPDWFIDCTRKKEFLPTEKYKWNHENLFPAVSNPSSEIPIVTNGNSGFEVVRAQISSAIHEVSTDQIQIAGRSEAEQLNILPLKISREENIFSDVSFRIRLEEPNLIRQWTEFLTDCGGNVFDDEDPRVANYLLCPPVEWGCLPSRHDGLFEKTVTILWIQNCKDAQKIVDSCSDPLFKPLPAAKDSKIFTGLVFGIIGFANCFVKEVITKFITLFDGKVETSLVVKPKNGILPCTHLIVGSDSDKVKDCKRKLTSLKVIDPSWVLECIINDKLLSECDFSFTNVIFDGYIRSDDLWMDADTPAVLENNLDDSEDEITFDNESIGTEPISDVFHALASNHDVNRMTNNQLTEGTLTSSISFRAADAENNSSPLRIKPKLRLQGITQALNDIPSPNENAPALESSSLNLSKVGRIIGAAASKVAQPDCSTPVGRKRPSYDLPFDGNEEVQAHPPAVKRISVKTEPSVSKVEPICVPSDMKPRVAGFSSQFSNLAASSHRLALQQLQQGSSNFPCVESRYQAEPVIPSTESSNPLSSRKKWEIPPVIATKPRAHHLPIVEWRTESYSRLDKTIDISSDKNTDGDIIITKDSNLEQERQPILKTGTVVIHSPIQLASTSNRIVERQGNSLEPIVPKVAVSNGADSFISIEPMSALTSSPINQEVVQTKKMFLFTSVPSEMKNQLVSDIASLGGGVIFDEQGIPDEVTHLLCGKLVRGTKLMGCLASARWMLTLEFVGESIKAGKWLAEQSFEWIEHTENMDDRQRQIAVAGRRWREKLAGVPSSERGAFYGYRVILYASREKANGLIPLLIAGKAEVVIRSKLETSVIAWKPTHAVIAKPNGTEWNKNEMKLLDDLGVKAYQLDYLAKYLLEENFSEKSCLNPEFVTFLSRGR